MIISMVVAAARNNVIGKDNKLLWTLPNDMRFFKNVTWGMPVIMGRKTFESLGKPLNGRKNIIISRQKLDIPGTVTTGNLDDALFLVKEMDVKEAMVIGGGEIYRMAFPRANRIYLTRVDAEPEGDTYFPSLEAGQWHLVRKQDHEADAKHAYGYSFQVWERGL